MEALGAASSIITVLHLTHKISILCWDIHSSIKNAREDIIRIIDEVNAIRTVLEALARLTANGPSSHANRTPIFEAVAQLDKPLKECESELQSLAGELRKAIPDKKRPGLKAVVWNFKEKDIALRLEHICRLKGTLQLALTLDQTTLLIESRIQALSLRATVEDDHIKRLRRSILDWLGAPSSSSILNDSQKVRTTNTGDWFLRGPVFNAWRSTAKSFLWLHGIPGSGKTVLCSSIIEELRGSSKLLLYFFFDFSTQGGSTVSAWLRSWISQLLVQSESIPSPVRALYDAHHDGFQQPSDKEFLETLHKLLDDSGEAYLIIDALDECRGKPESLAMIEEIVQYDIKNIHILITSRNEADIAETLLNLSGQNIEIEGDGLKEDIQEHVRNALLKDSRLSRWPVEIQAEITTTLTQAAGGMFRWAACQLESLSGCTSLRDLRKTLKSLPTTLNGTYSRILTNIHPTSAGVALRILSWLCFAFQLPTLEDMAEILAVDLDTLKYDPDAQMLNPEDVLTICGSLIMRSRTSGGSLRLSHHSVREYLVSQHTLSSGLSSYSVKDLESNEMICKICLIHLQTYDDWWQKEARKGSQLPTTRPRLIEYCLNYWMEHFNRAGRPSELCSLAQDLLLRPSSHFLDWAWLAGNINFYMHNEHPMKDCCKPINILLYYSALTGSTTLAEAILAHGADINAVGGALGTALSVSAYRGDFITVEWLLSKGADVNAQAYSLGSALHSAACWGWVDIVKLLLARGADVNTLKSPHHLRSVLFDAIHSQYNREETVRLLLEAGADARATSGGTSLLQLRALQDREDIVTLLIEYGADVNHDGSTCLQEALYGGRLNMANTLVRKGAEIDSSRGGPFGSPLNAAVLGGSVAFDYLINNHATDCTIPDNEGRTALHIASMAPDIEVIRRLLELGLKVNERDHKGWSAIHYAASLSTAENLKILLPHWKAEPQGNSSEWSPLHLACRQNQPEALDLLIKAGFQPTTVSTTEPECRWSLHDIAVLHENSRLISGTGEILHSSIQPSPVARSNPAIQSQTAWGCDGCILPYDMLVFSYGWRFTCTVCPDFDYCFMCQLTAHKTHPHPLILISEKVWTDDPEELLLTEMG